MSTRANIVIKDSYDHLIFYRHSDGYPEGTMPTLNQFLDLVKNGKIRDNVSQASGHLILIGHEEYKDITNNDFYSWKIGSYEPTTCIHGDIEWLYEVNLNTKQIAIYDYKALNKYKLPKKGK